MMTSDAAHLLFLLNLGLVWYNSYIVQTLEGDKKKAVSAELCSRRQKQIWKQKPGNDLSLWPRSNNLELKRANLSKLHWFLTLFYCSNYT